MGLVGVLGDDLLDGELAARLDVPAKPHQAETPSPQQFHFLETVRKTVAKYVFLLLSQSKRLRLRHRVISIFLLGRAFNGLDSPLLFSPPTVLLRFGFLQFHLLGVLFLDALLLLHALMLFVGTCITQVYVVLTDHQLRLLP